MTSENQTTADRTHEAIVGSVTVEQSVAILANGTRAALHSLAGEDHTGRFITLAGFLFHLCQVEPERADQMRGILDAVKEAVCHAE